MMGGAAGSAQVEGRDAVLTGGPSILTLHVTRKQPRYRHSNLTPADRLLGKDLP